jgi:hypothetical protein
MIHLAELESGGGRLRTVGEDHARNAIFCSESNHLISFCSASSA